MAATLQSRQDQRASPPAPPLHPTSQPRLAVPPMHRPNCPACHLALRPAVKGAAHPVLSLNSLRPLPTSALAWVKEVTRRDVHKSECRAISRTPRHLPAWRRGLASLAWSRRTLSKGDRNFSGLWGTLLP
ncbi:hypothetical protein E2C01_079161 [Portunus trituberculatus]|uniref:Uncharacterized protein n=1 Tax=Portunus trituberculatus TaxID=210409 RepID=A0A5B7IPW5_PORTR|nr:hypothetical protein [Portunus trituberculatus]